MYIEDKPVENSYEDFVERFNKLSDEAYSYGMEVTLTISEDDRFVESSRMTHIYKGKFYSMIGMLHCLIKRMHKDDLDVNS